MTTQCDVQTVEVAATPLGPWRIEVGCKGSGPWDRTTIEAGDIVVATVNTMMRGEEAVASARQLVERANATFAASPVPSAQCVCQDQHRRGRCTEPGCPYSITSTDPKTATLLPCPFCGSEADHAALDKGPYKYVVRCLDCAARVQTVGDKDDAFRYWNTRTPQCDVRTATDWKPIETAPLDGSEILILTAIGATQARFAPGGWSDHHEGREYYGPVWVCCDDKWQIEIEDCGKDGMHHGMATHWMPLPAAPPQTGGAGLGT